LVVVERQRFPVLPAADARVLVHVDHESAADPKRIRGAFGGACRPRAEQGRQQNRCGNGAAHAPFYPDLDQPERNGRARWVVSLTRESTQPLGGGNLMTP